MTQEQITEICRISIEINKVTQVLTALNSVIANKEYTLIGEEPSFQFGQIRRMLVDVELAEYLKPYFEAKLDEYKKSINQL